MDLRQERERYSRQVMKRTARKKKRELEKFVYRNDCESNGVGNEKGQFDSTTDLERPDLGG